MKYVCLHDYARHRDPGGRSFSRRILYAASSGIRRGSRRAIPNDCLGIRACVHVAEPAGSVSDRRCQLAAADKGQIAQLPALIFASPAGAGVVRALYPQGGGCTLINRSIPDISAVGSMPVVPAGDSLLRLFQSREHGPDLSSILRDYGTVVDRLNRF